MQPEIPEPLKNLTRVFSSFNTNYPGHSFVVSYLEATLSITQSLDGVWSIGKGRDHQNSIKPEHFPATRPSLSQDLEWEVLDYAVRTYHSIHPILSISSVPRIA